MILTVLAQCDSRLLKQRDPAPPKGHRSSLPKPSAVCLPAGLGCETRDEGVDGQGEATGIVTGPGTNALVDHG